MCEMLLTVRVSLYPITKKTIIRPSCLKLRGFSIDDYIYWLKGEFGKYKHSCWIHLSLDRLQNNNITKLKSNIESQFDDDKKGKHVWYFFVLGNWKIDEGNFARAFKCDPCTIFDVHMEMGDVRPRAARWIENSESKTTKPPKCLLFFYFSKWKMSMEKISSSHDHIRVYNVRTYEPVLIYAYEK